MLNRLNAKTIKFIPDSKDVENFVAPPKPAKLTLPDWYKKTTSYYGGNQIEVPEDFSEPKTFKTCMPFLDIMGAGYIQETWVDLFIEHDGKDWVRYATPNGRVQMVSIRDQKQLGKMPRMGGHEMFFMNWARVWNPVLPKGYSAIFQHPAYRNDLPFTSISAIIDSDNYYAAGKVGFFIKEGFQGVIPAGTPMYQIIPFKRDSWNSEIVSLTENETLQQDKQVFNTRYTFLGGYKKNYWNRKEFN